MNPQFAARPARDAAFSGGLALVSQADGDVAESAITDTELGYLTGLSANLEARLDALEGRHVYRVKTAHETVNNSTVYQDDDHLVNIPLEGNSYYAFFSYNEVYNLSSNPDIKVQYVFSQADWVAVITYNMAGASGTTYLSVGTDLTPGLMAQSAGLKAFFFSGRIKTVTAGTLKMQWAQNTAVAEDTFLREGSYILLHKINA